MIDIYWFSAAIGFLIALVIRKILSDRARSLTKDDTNSIRVNKDDKKKSVENCGSESCCQSQTRVECSSNATNDEANIDKTTEKVVVVYGTTTGKSQQFAQQLSEKLKNKDRNVELLNAAEFGSNIEDKMKEITAGGKTNLVVIISTYTEGQR